RAMGSGMLLVARRAITRTSRVAFAHVRAALGVAVGLAATVVINLAVEVDPHHRVAGTTRFGFSLGRMLPGRRRHADRGWASCRRSGGLALRRRGPPPPPRTPLLRPPRPPRSTAPPP